LERHDAGVARSAAHRRPWVLRTRDQALAARELADAVGLAEAAELIGVRPNTLSRAWQRHDIPRDGGEGAQRRRKRRRVKLITL
jgi:hypothetical protein